MKFAIQRCCPTPIFLKQYETSTNAVLERLGVEFVDIKEFNCCGYPLRNIDFKAHLLLSARNLSLAEERKLNIITFCNCCYGTLKHVNHLLKEDASLREEMNRTLAKEGRRYDGTLEIKHVLEVLYHDIGLDRLKEKILKVFKDLRIATHYGCHVLRPREIVQFDNSVAPSLFDNLVEATGAKSIDWPRKLECCGSPMLGVNDDLSMDLTEKKIMDAQKGGADYLCVACPYCQLQFDRVQKMMLARGRLKQGLPSFLYTQILGLGLGIDPEILGIRQNELDGGGLLKFLE